MRTWPTLECSTSSVALFPIPSSGVVFPCVYGIWYVARLSFRFQPYFCCFFVVLCVLCVACFGLQEKSLGGLCRRFVQLFLVGNEVVSVGEAAEKLSDAADVSLDRYNVLRVSQENTAETAPLCYCKRRLDAI